MAIDPPYRFDPFQNPVDVKWISENSCGVDDHTFAWGSGLARYYIVEVMIVWGPGDLLISINVPDPGHPPKNYTQEGHGMIAIIIVEPNHGDPDYSSKLASDWTSLMIQFDRNTWGDHEDSARTMLDNMRVSSEEATSDPANTSTIQLKFQSSCPVNTA